MTNEPTTQEIVPTRRSGGEPPAGYGDLLRDIKKVVASAQGEAQRAVNAQMIEMYWRIGKLIVERREEKGWGVNVVPRLSADLRAAEDQSWGQIRGLMDRGTTLAAREEALVHLHITAFLQDLGLGFTLVGRQYAHKLGAEEFRPDLLFYHLDLHRYVVIEIQAELIQPAHLARLGFHTAVIDEKVRDPDRDETTLGILIAKSKKHEGVEYLLRTSAQRPAVSAYQDLPPTMRTFLPSAEDLSRIVDEVLQEDEDLEDEGVVGESPGLAGNAVTEH